MFDGKYAAIARIEMQNSMVYVTEQLAHALFMCVIIFVLFSLWHAIFSGAAQGSAISGFTLNNMVWYLVASEVIVAGSGTSQRIAKKLSELVKSGDIANLLNKPYNLIYYSYASSIGPTIMRSLITFAMCATLAYFLVGGFAFDFAAAPLIIVAALLAVTLQFMLYVIIGFASFWFEDISAFRWINEKITFVLGGMLLPLTFFPKWLMGVAQALPYSYIAYAPAYLFVHFDRGMFVETIAIQLAWIAVFAVIAYALYRKGVYKVSVNGG